MQKNVSRLSRWWTRFTNFEFWPFWLIYSPLVIQYVYYAVRAKSLFFFSASNPGIEFSGMLGESKIRIYEGIADQYIPKTSFLAKTSNSTEVRESARALGLKYPFVLKPDRGERGWMVKVIRNDEQLKQYLAKNQVDFLIQEWIDLPVEMAIFYFRHPNSAQGTVSSIAIKEFYHITGNGANTVAELVELDVRGKMFKEKLFSQSDLDPESVPAANENIRIGHIGNHSLGTIFKNGNALINDKLTSQIDKLSQSITGFYFGRFDIRCASISSVEEGEFKIIELNGSGSEPAHIYDPESTVIRAFKDIAFHLRKMFEISIYNHQQGVAYMDFDEFKKMMRIVRSYRRLQKHR